MLSAYALAAASEDEAALSRVEDIRAVLAAASQEAKDKNPLAPIVAQAVTADIIEPTFLMINARIAVSQGRLTDASDLLKGKALRSTPITRQFYDDYEAARSLSAEDAPELDALLPKPERSPKSLGSLASSLLISPESERELIDYKKSRPDILGALVSGAFSMGTSLLGGISRTSGFRSVFDPDGPVMVEYTGDTTSGPVVQEMTLLRAAEIARERGNTHFIVSDRKDYQRYLTVSQYGTEISRTLTGYKTELTISLLDTSAEDEHLAFNALEVIDALGPVYY